jgi:hypothetical protein
MDTQRQDFHRCIGVCMADPDSGHCIGCGIPLPPALSALTEPTPVADPATQRESSPSSGPGSGADKPK